MPHLRKIKNFDAIATSPARKYALQIAEAGLQAIDTEAALARAIRVKDGMLCINEEMCTLGAPKRIFVVTIGKCALASAAAFEKILGADLTGGIAFGITTSEAPPLRKIKVFRGSHPLPTEENVQVAKQIVKFLNDLTEEDLVIAVISGGGSTLLCLPEAGGSCIEEQLILKTLTRAGATIQEINTVRKHISAARGGHLAQYAYPAQVIGLIISDVPGNDLSMVASGPTIQDTTTLEDAERILEKYSVLRTCGLDHCGMVETPKEDKYFKKVYNFLVVSNMLALEAMRQEAERLGFNAEIRTHELSGEARDVGHKILAELKRSPKKTVLLYGGETTVTMAGHGTGGRNQELALSAAGEAALGEIVLAVASDGHDNGAYAGAIGDEAVRAHADMLRLVPDTYLIQNNTTPFFEKTGDYLLADDTGSNVSDLVVALKE